MTCPWPRWTLLLMLACCPDAIGAESPFSIHTDQGLEIRCQGQTIARAGMPAGLSVPRIAPQPSGGVAAGEGWRLELAAFADRLEYTVEFQLPPPQKPWCVLHLPLPEKGKASIVHGTFEREPQTTTISQRAAGKSPRAADSISMVRFITVDAPGLSYALDTQPRGAMGDTPADSAGVMRALVCCPVNDGLELRCVLPGSHPACFRAKLIFYAPPSAFERLHPFRLMNYRHAFEKVVKLAFSSGPKPKKPYERRPVGVQAYRSKTGYGWLGTTEDLKLQSCSTSVPLYGAHVGSQQPGRFRIDLPPGHYYLTLNFGDPDGPVGPLRVLVNGQPQIERLALPSGRYRAELLWITSDRDHLQIEFQGLDGAAWQISALTVSALGTLGEDFTLTRPWWHFPQR